MIQDRARPSAQHGWFRELGVPIVEQAVVSEAERRRRPRYAMHASGCHPL